jgi:hypothetical protein
MTPKTSMTSAPRSADGRAFALQLFALQFGSDAELILSSILQNREALESLRRLFAAPTTVPGVSETKVPDRARRRLR